MKRAAFTLVELCVVVVIISILAMIVVPNLQLAGTRAKISRVQADFSTIKTALESYHVDTGLYPETNESGTTPTVLSTPVAYLSNTLFKDPLYKSSVHGEVMDDNQWLRYNRWAGAIDDDPYVHFHLRKYGSYWMYSNAPFAGGPREIVTIEPSVTTLLAYDPTNGTISPGRIIRGAL